MELLIMLVERRGELVTRADIVGRLWGDGVFVEVETGINTAIRKIRRALNESSENGRGVRLLETVSGKGYRFAAAAVTVSDRNDSVTRLLVLPFVNLSAGGGGDHYADGLTDDVIATLGQIDPGHLTAIGRMTAMAYRASTKSLSDIGAELNVQFVVEGSIRSEGTSLRVRCTLNRVADLAQRWSASYEKSPAQLPGVARELSVAIAAEITGRPAAAPGTALGPRQSHDAAAYDAYLRGRYFWYQLTPVTTRRAVEYYSRAAEIDPHYALAWSGIAEAFASAPINGDADPRQMWPRAREAARRAIDANPDLSEAHAVCGQVNWFFEWDWIAALDCHRRAIELDPGNAWSHAMFGHILSQLGRHEEGRPYMDQACNLEPMAAPPQAMASQVAFQAGDFDTALQRARRALAIDSEFWVGYMMLGQVCERTGETDVALDALTMASRLSGGNSKPVGLRGYILANAGQTSAAREVLAMLDDLARVQFVPPFAPALVHAGLGDDARVFESLQHAFDARDVHLAFLTVDPKWDRFRSHPQFVALLDACAFERTRQPAKISSPQTRMMPPRP